MTAIPPPARVVAAFALALSLATGAGVIGQTREKGPWWPSPHGPRDQAGNSNYITPEKIVRSLQLARTGQVYELGHPYESTRSDTRPYYINVTPAGAQKEGQSTGHVDYFTGSIGQMGTSYDAMGHMGLAVRMADGALKPTFYNGFTEEEMTGRFHGARGLEALGIEHIRPIITHGVLIDVAAYKGVPALPRGYEVTTADLRGALARQGVAEDAIERGDAVLLHYGWGQYWTDPAKYLNNGQFDAPGIGIDGAAWLAAKGIATVGADTCCVQIMPWPGGRNPHHEMFFSGGIWLENMNLTELARDRVYEFLFVGLSERIRGATGSPVRPLAIR